MHRLTWLEPSSRRLTNPRIISKRATEILEKPTRILSRALACDLNLSGNCVGWSVQLLQRLANGTLNRWDVAGAGIPDHARLD